MSELHAVYALYVDMGTTNTRVWAVRGDEVLARATAGVGVRDTARDGSPVRVRTALRDLINEVRAAVGASFQPVCVAAAGMITSPLGLLEVPHLIAPVAPHELAIATQAHHFPDITELPVLLVPGVRSGPHPARLEEIAQTDVMRGEETLCAGLLALGRLQPPAVVLNLGSHWKAIRIDAEGRIAASVTSLTGEMIHAVQTTTILASAVPAARPTESDDEWCAAGMNVARDSGLARAMFCVRLLELAGRGTPAQRMAFLIGAFIAAECDGLRAAGMLSAETSVVLTGGGAVVEAWRAALARESPAAVCLTEDEVEKALLAGLRGVVARFVH